MTNRRLLSCADLVELDELDEPLSDQGKCVPLYGRTPRQLADAIRRGEWPRDMDFDRFMARELLPVSNRYWSQLVVAERMSQWLDALGVESVVDIGSGPGKLCVAGALAGERRFVGIEQRKNLVHEARRLAELFGVSERARFVHAVFGETRVPQADAYYLYNPFGENLFSVDDALDGEVELSNRRFVQDTRAVEALLRDAPVGTHLITYNGFGGRVPASYKLIHSDRALPCLLRLWTKVTPVELGEGPYDDSLG